MVALNAGNAGFGFHPNGSIRTFANRPAFVVGQPIGGGENAKHCLYRLKQAATGAEPETALMVLKHGGDGLLGPIGVQLKRLDGSCRTAKERPLASIDPDAACLVGKNKMPDIRARGVIESLLPRAIIKPDSRVAADPKRAAFILHASATPAARRQASRNRLREPLTAPGQFFDASVHHHAQISILILAKRQNPLTVIDVYKGGRALACPKHNRVGIW